ncbi:MAG TPA: hypothetical protein PKJ16_18300 [Spirochaetota bacterium]|nr:hypothetical protein [Spirochaetota bacterium]HPU87073.1 hypothetical protein [Spirochaetota bacterium]
MKKYLVIAILLLMVHGISCTNSINDLFGSKGAASSSTVDPGVDSAQFLYLGYLYGDSTGLAIHNQVLDGLDPADQSELQKALDASLRFPLPVDDPASGLPAAFIPGTNWHRTRPASFADAANPEEIAEMLFDWFLSMEGIDGANGFCAAASGRISNLETYSRTLVADDFVDPDKTSLDLSGIDLGDNAGMIAATNAGMQIQQCMLMIANVFFQQGGVGANPEVIDRLNQISFRRVTIQKGLKSIEKSVDQADAVASPDTRTDVNGARYFLEQLHTQLGACVHGSDIAAIVRSQMLSGGVYEDVVTRAYHAALASGERIAISRSAANLDVIARLDKLKDDSAACDNQTAQCMAISFALCAGLGLPNCGEYATLICAAKQQECIANPPQAVVGSVQYYFKEPLQYAQIALEDIALLRRLSLERLALLPYAIRGSDLLTVRADVARKDLQRLLVIKEGIRGYWGNIDTYIANSTLDTTGADAYRLYDSMNQETEATDPTLHALMSAYVGTQDAYKRYQLAMYAVVLDWEAQLRAHIAAST